MKKRKVLGAIAGVMAIAIAAGATYAWFVSTPAEQTLTVNAATIALKETDIPVDLPSNVLPNELVKVTGLGLENVSTREALVKLSIDLKLGNALDGKGNWLDQDVVADTLKTVVMSLGYDQTDVDDGIVFKEVYGEYYVFLPTGLSPAGVLGFEFRVSKLLGGNTYDRIYDYQDEHGSTFTFTYSAQAVQGSYEAVKEVFSQDVADEFGKVGDGAGGVLLDF